MKLATKLAAMSDDQIYKDVLAKIAKLTKENFEREGFEVKIQPNEKDKCFETYIIEISW